MKTTHGSLTGAALVLAWAQMTTVCIRADEAEDKAVKAVKKLGGRIMSFTNVVNKQPVFFVYLDNSKVTDAGLKDLAGLKRLRGLDLAVTKVTDAGLKHLAGLKQLRILDLRKTHVTDAGLKHLEGLKQLRILVLADTHVTDAGLKHLAGLKQLQGLHLAGTKVTGKGKADLKKALPKLRTN